VKKKDPFHYTKAEIRFLDQVGDILDNPEAVERAYMARQLVQCTLPHSDPGDKPAWVRTNGNLSLVIRPGWDARGNKSIGYPYGSLPRLVLFWLTAEAVKTRSPKIELGNTLAEFMRELGLSWSTGAGPRSDARRLREQMNRLFRASISFEQSLERPDGAEGSRWLDMRVAPKGELWWDPKMPDQGALWGSWVQLSQEFFEAITAAPVPLDMRALRALKRSPLALDLYTWATYRTFSVRKAGKAVTVPYGALQAQLGTNYERERDFKTALKDALGKVQRVYPALKCEMEEGGLTILPGLTAVRTKAKAIKPTDEPPKALPIDRHSLKPETYQKAREAAPGYDVRYLEELWREWVSSKGIQITHPDGHFLRFCKTQKKLKPNP